MDKKLSDQTLRSISIFSSIFLISHSEVRQYCLQSQQLKRLNLLSNVHYSLCSWFWKYAKKLRNPSFLTGLLQMHIRSEPPTLYIYGHNPFTHDFVTQQALTNCSALKVKAFAVLWHCIRRSYVLNKSKYVGCLMWSKPASVMILNTWKIEARNTLIDYLL